MSVYAVRVCCHRSWAAPYLPQKIYMFLIMRMVDDLVPGDRTSIFVFLLLPSQFHSSRWKHTKLRWAAQCLPQRMRHFGDRTVGWHAQGDRTHFMYPKKDTKYTHWAHYNIHPSIAFMLLPLLLPLLLSKCALYLTSKIRSHVIMNPACGYSRNVLECLEAA